MFRVPDCYVQLLNNLCHLVAAICEPLEERAVDIDVPTPKAVSGFHSTPKSQLYEANKAPCEFCKDTSK